MYIFSTKAHSTQARVMLSYLTQKEKVKLNIACILTICFSSETYSISCLWEIRARKAEI